MFGSSYANRASTYARIATETSIESASPHKLILMLYDGALLSIRTASTAMQNGDIPTKGASVSKAINIITNGLKASLDLGVGGDLAIRLDALYEYMSERLFYANLNNNPAALDEVANLLSSLREAWTEIADEN